MRILILSCNTGEGHNSTARAIRQCAEKAGDSVDIFDALSYWPTGTNRFICSGQTFLYKNAPELFGFGYRVLELVSEKTVEKKEEKKTGDPLSLLVRRPSAKLYEEMEAGNYDAVICVHVFASVMMTEIRRVNQAKQPTFFVATDYTCSPGVNVSDFDGCFIPDASLVPEFTSLGVPEEKLIPTGIPVREDFYTSLPKEEAKCRLGLPKDRRVILLMGGSMGCGPIGRIAETVAESMPKDAVLVAVCGRNEKLFEQLSALPQAGKTLFPVGFTKEIPTYMDASELIITKAGGLSSTEAATKHLPMVFIDAIPGLEIHNRDFFADAGFAVYGEKPDEVAELVGDLLRNPERLEAIRSEMRDRFRHRSAQEICDYVRRCVAEQNTVTEESAAL